VRIITTKDVFIPEGTEMNIEVDGEGDKIVPSIVLDDDYDVDSVVFALLFLDKKYYKIIEEEKK